MSEAETPTEAATGFDALKGLGTQAEAVVHERKVDAQGRAYATGRRKNAVARVWLKPGSGKITVSWRVTDGRMRLDIWAPAGIEIDARLPAGLEGDVYLTAVPLGEKRR